MGAEESKPVQTPDIAVGTAPEGTERAKETEHAEDIPSALVIVGPSGVGKGTLIRRLMENNDKFGFSVSHTTRQPREGEKHGTDYFFTTKENFAGEVAEGKFLEYAEVHKNLYGTSIAAVRTVLQGGRVCVLDIDVQGARAIRKSPLRAIFVFVAPPSFEDLAARLAGRGTEDSEQITQRLNNAKLEISSLNERGLYDYLLINDDLQDTLNKLTLIAQRALDGQPPEPGMVPERVVLEDAPLPEIVSKAQLDHATSSASSFSEEPPFTEPSFAAGFSAAIPTLSPVAFSNGNTPAAAAANHTTNISTHDSLATSNDAATSESTPLDISPAQGTTVPEDAEVEALAEKQKALHLQELHSSLPPELNVAATAAAAAAAAAAANAAEAAAASTPAPAAAAPVVSAAAATAAAAFSGAVLPVVNLPSIPDGLVQWQGRVALVTGASSGIGWAICEALALAGLRVVAVARRRDRLEDLQRHMHALGVASGSFLPVVCDITKEPEVATLPKIVLKRWPDSGIDVLVNNAGMSRNDASLCDGNINSWVEMLSTNVLGTCMCTKAVVQDMKRRGQFGHIINMIGLSGHRIPDGPQGGGFYCATKSAVKAITEGLRQEARGQQLPLRVSGISPGMVETEFFSVRSFGDDEAAKRATSVFHCLQPTDIAQAVLWCLSAPSHVEVNDIVIRPTAQLI